MSTSPARWWCNWNGFGRKRGATVIITTPLLSLLFFCVSSMIIIIIFYTWFWMTRKSKLTTKWFFFFEFFKVPFPTQIHAARFPLGPIPPTVQYYVIARIPSLLCSNFFYNNWFFLFRDSDDQTKRRVRLQNESPFRSIAGRDFQRIYTLQRRQKCWGETVVYHSKFSRVFFPKINYFRRNNSY